MRLSESTHYAALIMFFLVRAIEIHIFKQYYCVRTLCKTSKFIVYRLVSERKRQVVTEQTRLLSTTFLCKEFKLENIYSEVNFSGKMFAVIFICGTYFCGLL